MEKFKETIAKACSAIAILPIASLALIACTDANSNKNLNTSTQNVSNISDTHQPSTGNVNNGTEISDENNEVYPLNGIYSYTRVFDFNDIVYADEQELFTFFKTRSVNGAKKAALELGFNEFIENITKRDGEYVSVLFNKNEFSYILKLNDLSYKNLNESSHAFEITESGYQTGDDEPIIMFDNEKNEVTLLYQFNYTNESGNKVETPLYFKTTLAYNEHTFFEADENVDNFYFKANSSFLNISENHPKYNDSLNQIAQNLGMEVATLDKVSEYFAKDNIVFSIDNVSEKLYYVYNNNVMNIVPINKTTNTYDFLGFKFEVLNSINQGEIRLSANLDEEVKFEITLLNSGTSSLNYTLTSEGYEVSGIDDPSITKVIIPNMYNGEKVVGIAENAFKDNTNLSSIFIGTNVSHIGASSFSGCTNLTSIELPESVTSIGPSAFESCSTLASIKLGNNIKSIAANAFANCEALTEFVIPESVVVLGGSTFKGCTNLSSLTLGKNITSVATAESFENCTNLTNITINCSAFYTNAIGTDACGGLLANAKEIRVLATIDDGSNSYLNENFTKTTSSDNLYNIYSVAE